MNAQLRTAFCISGQLRSGNLSWDSGYLRSDAGFKLFGEQDPPTPIETTIERVLKVFAKQGGLDVFMYVSCSPGGAKQLGHPRYSRPTVGDNKTNNIFFCLVESEKDLVSVHDNSTLWHSVFVNRINAFAPDTLRQLHDIYQSNQMAINYSKANNVSYTYKVRWRPDLAVPKPFPLFERLNFQPPLGKSNQCDSSILFAIPFITPLPIAVDQFSIGRANDMDNLFNHYLEFVSNPGLNSSLLNTSWTLEGSLEYFLLNHYRICLVINYDILLTIIRTRDHYFQGQAQGGNKITFSL